MRHSPRAVPALVWILALALLAGGRAAVAEELWSESGFFVEMPAGFEYRGGDNKTRFSFADPQDGMEFDIIAYEAGRYPDAASLAAESLRKLDSKGESEEYTYEGRKAVFATLSFSLNGAAREGLAVFIEGRRPAVRAGSAGPAAGQGSPAPERSFALLAHSPGADFEAYSPFILSCLDSFSIDRAARRSPGPVSQYLLAWPPERAERKRVTLPGGREAELPWSAAEAEHEAETVGREYGVLKAYADEPVLWAEAWARFYRMAYRESAARLDRLALELSRDLSVGDPTELARRVLAWSQLFAYERDPEGTDFVPPLAAAFEARGDCDARAVAAAALLERLGIDAVLMLSREYSHAMLAVDVPGGGQRFAFDGKKYLVAETTAKVGLGMIAADQADWSKWMGVQLGD